MCVCIVYVGTWDLLDVYVIPTSELYSSWVTLVIGANVCFVGQMIQPHINNYLQVSYQLPTVTIYIVLRSFNISYWCEDKKQILASGVVTSLLKFELI